MKKLLKKKEGFTLVELIVVIAILAILATVAIPAYSGYIKKANEAADTQILSAINTAFAAACVQNGFANTDVETATITVTTKKVASLTVSAAATDVTMTDAQKTKIASDFMAFFGENKDAELKYYGSFTFANGNFTGVAATE